MSEGSFELGPRQLAWVEALESGKYEQGSGRLKHDGRYCCLGVLCELAGLEFVEFADGAGYYKHNRENYDLNVPYLTQEEYGLHGGFGELKQPDQGYSSLAGMNDDGSYNFARIAAYIRANPANVFKKVA